MEPREDIGSLGRIAIGASSRRGDLTAMAAAAGWSVVEAGPVAVLVLDGGEAPDPLPDRTALLAIMPGITADDGEAAYRIGATHWIGGAFTREDFAMALRFAARVTAALRHGSVEPAGRRSDDTATGDARGDAADDAIPAWLHARLDGSAPVSVALVSLTRFEFVNAAFGRPTGDALLAAAEARIAAALPASAVVVRRSGAEFVVAVEGGSAAAAAIIDDLDSALSRPFDAAGATVNLGSRIGVAERSAGDDAAALLRRAGNALASAKASDAGTTHVAGVEDGVAIDRLAADLHRAIDADEIEIVFQPQVRIASGAITGVEALARWDHPVLGSLGAEKLFAAADRADLGLALSDHIQRVALDSAAAWPATLDGLRLSINVTAADLARAGFADAFLERIAASGFARTRVTVEIVETGLIEDLDRAAALLAQLRGAGCRIAIDDFGTGYSSLAYLKSLPVDYLKIDRSLTQDIAGSDRDRVVVRGVIAMARSLGMETIAEGVETEDQRARLGAEGCTYFQGFLCSAPLDDARLKALVEGRRPALTPPPSPAPSTAAARRAAAPSDPPMPATA